MPPKRQKTSSTEAAVQQPRSFSRDLSLLLAHAKTREQLLFRILAETGITLKELVSLKKTDLTPHERTLTIRPETTKHGTPRTITLSTQLAHRLATHARTQPTEHLFSTRQSAQPSTRRIEQLLKQACERAGIKPLTARDLRNAYREAATTAAKDDEELRRLTGLKTITKDKALTKEEQARLAKTIKKQPARDRALITTLLETGKPLDDTITLTKKDITTLKLTTQLATLLRSLATTAEEPLFSTRQSAQLTRRRAEQIISDTGKRARIPRLTSHTLTTTAQRGGAP
ncbi:site-specific integrase [Candidatus Woesearchaeota archaeon]|nr:site-specific integrase [Candidatus Woesearchaeota archaeon]